MESLRQSILEQAFSGQLVPQDPDDELASVLLERIHTEREARSETDTHKSRFNTLGHAHPVLFAQLAQQLPIVIGHVMKASP